MRIVYFIFVFVVCSLAAPETTVTLEPHDYNVREKAANLFDWILIDVGMTWIPMIIEPLLYMAGLEIPEECSYRFAHAVGCFGENQTGEP